MKTILYLFLDAEGLRTAAGIEWDICTYLCKYKRGLLCKQTNNKKCFFPPKLLKMEMEMPRNMQMCR